MSEKVSEFAKDMAIHIGKHVFDNWIKSQNKANTQELEIFTASMSLVLVSDILKKLNDMHYLTTRISEDDFGWLGGYVNQFFCDYLKELTGKTFDGSNITEQQVNELLRHFYEKMRHN